MVWDTVAKRRCRDGWRLGRTGLLLHGGRGLAAQARRRHSSLLDAHDKQVEQAERHENQSGDPHRATQITPLFSSPSPTSPPLLVNEAYRGLGGCLGLRDCLRLGSGCGGGLLGGGAGAADPVVVGLAPPAVLVHLFPQSRRMHESLLDDRTPA